MNCVRAYVYFCDIATHSSPYVQKAKQLNVSQNGTVVSQRVAKQQTQEPTDNN